MVVRRLHFTNSQLFFVVVFVCVVVVVVVVVKTKQRPGGNPIK